MAGLHGFNPKEDYDGYLVPDGSYNAAIVESEEHDNSKKTGTYLSLVFEILEGPQKGRKLWTNLNLNNPSEQAVRISRAHLKQICKAVGVLEPADSSDLHDIPLVISVEKEKRNDTGELANRIKKFESRLEAQTAETTETVGAGEAPWKK